MPEEHSRGGRRRRDRAPSFEHVADDIVPLVAGLALFVGATESLQPDDTVLGGSLAGAVLGQFAAAVFGVPVVSEQTVKTHVSRLLGKLGLRDRTQAAIFAYESGLIRPGSG